MNFLILTAHSTPVKLSERIIRMMNVEFEFHIYSIFSFVVSFFFFFG